MAIALKVPHISAYNLIYEEGTGLSELLRKGKVRECDEELALQMFGLLIDMLEREGFEHYEISNFALPGRYSRHNTAYWQNVPYLGIGASAHSYNGYTRSWNVPDLRQYCDKIESGNMAYTLEQLSFDDFLSQEGNQAEFDRRVQKAIQTAVGNAHFLTGAVTDIFSKGYMQVLIGTKSLLGEGWDSPCINSLILASFVGSFMLSNQMRGRAIRVMKEHPEKTSNIWHLVCLRPWNEVLKADDNQISEDYSMLELSLIHISEPTRH